MADDSAARIDPPTSEATLSSVEAGLALQTVPRMPRKRDLDALRSRSHAARREGDEARWSSGLEQLSSEYERVASEGGRIPPSVVLEQFYGFIAIAAICNANGESLCFGSALQRMMRAVALGGIARHIAAARALCSMGWRPEEPGKALALVAALLEQRGLREDLSCDDVAVDRPPMSRARLGRL